MNLRRLSGWLSILGGVLLLASTTLLVSISLGEVGTTSTNADGTTVDTTYRTASIMQDSPAAALGWIAATLAFAVVAALLIRHAGVIGAAFVIAVSGLGVLASILTIGIFIMPGAACLGAAALLALVDRLDQRLSTPPTGRW